MNCLSICAAVELLLVILEGLFPDLSPYLPLGRSHVAQIGILFGTTWALGEIVTSLRKAKGESVRKD